MCTASGATITSVWVTPVRTPRAESIARTVEAIRRSSPSGSGAGITWPTSTKWSGSESLRVTPTTRCSPSSLTLSTLYSSPLRKGSTSRSGESRSPAPTAPQSRARGMSSGPSRRVTPLLATPLTGLQISG